LGLVVNANFRPHELLFSARLETTQPHPNRF
jgi:hypothetical protein